MLQLTDRNYLCLQLWSMMVCCIEYIHRNGSIELEWVIHNSPLYQTHSHYCLYHHHNSHHQQMKDCYNLKLWNKWNLHWGNTLVLGCLKKFGPAQNILGPVKRTRHYSVELTFIYYRKKCSSCRLRSRCSCRCLSCSCSWIVRVSLIYNKPTWNFFSKK